MAESNSKSINVLREKGGGFRDDSRDMFKILCDAAMELEEQYGENGFESNNIDPAKSECEQTELHISSKGCGGESFESNIVFDYLSKFVHFNSKKSSDDENVEIVRKMKIHENPYRYLSNQNETSFDISQAGSIPKYNFPKGLQTEHSVCGSVFEELPSNYRFPRQSHLGPDPRNASFYEDIGGVPFYEESSYCHHNDYEDFGFHLTDEEDSVCSPNFNDLSSLRIQSYYGDTVGIQGVPLVEFPDTQNSCKTVPFYEEPSFSCEANEHLSGTPLFEELPSNYRFPRSSHLQPDPRNASFYEDIGGIPFYESQSSCGFHAEDTEEHPLFEEFPSNYRFPRSSHLGPDPRNASFYEDIGGFPVFEESDHHCNLSDEPSVPMSDGSCSFLSSSRIQSYHGDTQGIQGEPIVEFPDTCPGNY